MTRGWEVVWARVVERGQAAWSRAAPPDADADPSPDHLDLRLVPLAAVGWGGAWLGTGAQLGWGGVVAVALFAAALVRRTAAAFAFAAACAALLGAGGIAAHRVHGTPLTELAGDEAFVVAEVVVRSDPQWRAAAGVRSAYVTVPVLVTELSARGRRWRLRAPVLLVVTGDGVAAWRTVRVGSRASAGGRVQPVASTDDVAAVLRVRAPPAAARPASAGWRAIERIRSGLQTAVAARPPEPRALVPALVLGDTSAMTPALTADFSATGLTHLTAVSGANLTLLLAFVLPVARWCGVRGRGMRVTGLVGVAVFVALCRTEPSVLRAAAMGLVALAALGAGGRRAGFRHLAVAALGLLLIDPYLSRSIGFGLSVAASAGILGWAGGWTRTLHRWLPRVLAEAVSVPLAAHLATLPVVAAISGQVSVSGLVANALAGPFVGPATVLGFVAAGLSLLSASAAAIVAIGASLSAQAILLVAHLGAGLAGSTWRWPVTPGALVLLGVVALGLGLAMGEVLARPWLAGVLAGLMLLALLGPPPRPGWPPRDWVLVGCDVGQGDGLVVRTGPRSAVVIDTGPQPEAMRRCLDGLDVSRVPVLVLTHFHADHVDGLSGALTHREVGEVWVSPLRSPAYEAASVERQAGDRGVAVRVPPVGLVVDVGAARISVLGPISPPELGEDESSVQNDASLVLRVEVAGVRMLLGGDVEPPGQRALLAAGTDLRADVVKVPHHGSARQERAFFVATGARVALVSAGLNNDYGHPAPATVRLVAGLGMTLLRTDTEGSVAVTWRDGRLAAVTERPG